jgi:hypothetical protein
MIYDFKNDFNLATVIFTPFLNAPNPRAPIFLTASACANGAINPSGFVVVNYDDNQSFTITASTGYHVDNVLVNGALAGAVSSYTFSNIKATQTIAAIFAIDTFTITINQEDYGTIAPSTSTVGYGSDNTFSITPNSGYYIESITTDTGAVKVTSPSGQTISFTNVTAAHTLTATFALEPTPMPTTSPSSSPSPTPITTESPNPNPTPTPTPTASPSPAATPASAANPTLEPIATPTSTSSPRLTSTQISISADASSAEVGASVKINGKLKDTNGNSLSDKAVTLYYKLAGSSYSIPIGSDTTNDAGEYNLQWVNTASGTFTLIVAWEGDTLYQPSSSTTTLSFLPYQNQNIFLVESNSTVSALAFNSTISELSFSVNGTSGTIGYVKATIARNLTPNPENIKVYLDGNQLNYIVTTNVDSWQLTFNYHHSTHKVSIVLAAGSPIPEFSSSVIISIVLLMALTVAVLAFTKNRKNNSDKS